MTGQIDRLETLLARVQENRQQPRSGIASNARAAQPHAAPVPLPLYAAAPVAAQAQPATAERVASPRAAEGRSGKSTATPLEMAVEGRLSAPTHAHAAQAQAQVPARAPTSHEGVVLVDPQPPQQTRPIAQVVSMNPPSLAATFGELLRRSLSLRPR